MCYGATGFAAVARRRNEVVLPDGGTACLIPATAGIVTGKRRFIPALFARALRGATFGVHSHSIGGAHMTPMLILIAACVSTPTAPSATVADTLRLHGQTQRITGVAIDRTGLSRYAAEERKLNVSAINGIVAAAASAASIG